MNLSQMPHLLRRTSVLALALLAACSGDGTGGSEPVSRVEISAPSTELEEGAKLQLSASAIGASGKVLNKPATWTSGNPAVANVSATGEVTGKLLGTAVITATVDGIAGSREFKVGPATVASVNVQPLSVPALTARPAAVEVRDGRGNPLPNRFVVLRAADTTIATVNLAGLVVGRKVGTTTLIAESEGKTGSSPLTVTASSVNFTVAGMYVTQGSQTRSGGIPLVAGRDGWLRVFGVASTENEASPRMRVRLFQNGTLLSTTDVAAGSANVVTAMQEGSANASWNVRIPGSLIRPGLAAQVEFNPDGELSEVNPGDNVFPAAGPQTFTVQNSYPHRLVLVPINHAASGTVASMTPADTAAYVRDLTKLFPLPGVETQIRQTYTSFAATLDPNDANGSWSSTLAEMNALRVADNSTAYYYGLLRLPYNSGIVGLGYIDAFAAIGLDGLSLGPKVFAHETGHNFGRRHAPCGSVGTADPGYPHAGGALGSFGIDITNGAVKNASMSDVMGYCFDNMWVSDYTFRAVLDHRASVQQVASRMTSTAAAGRSLLVWGRVGGGKTTLEPAFEITARPVMPARPGPHVVEALDAAGNRVFTFSFQAEQVADLPGAEQRHFAFSVPVTEADAGRIATLRLVSDGQRAERRASLTARMNRTGAEVAGASLRRSGSRLGLRWDAARFPMALVRDARTGEVLSFARGGDAALATATGEVDVVFSDGVRSQSRRMRATAQ